MPDTSSDADTHRSQEDAHRFPVRVYWEDTDGSGIVYHASYLRFAERARTELLRLVAGSQRVLLRDAGIAFPVRRLEIDYLKPAFLDDAIQVATRVIAAGAASIDLTQAIHRGDEVITRLRVRIACIDRQGRPTRIPATIRHALTATLATEAVTADA